MRSLPMLLGGVNKGFCIRRGGHCLCGVLGEISMGVTPDGIYGLIGVAMAGKFPLLLAYSDAFSPPRSEMKSSMCPAIAGF